ncbi:MAG: general secretion pathway protein J [Oleispira sp.]|jgi:general secretion pathway protein J
MHSDFDLRRCRPIPLQRGFTLLEVMIAISITALIGIASTNLLSNVIETKKVTDIRSEQLTTLQRFNQFVSRDIEQVINRDIRDQYGDRQPALIIDSPDYLAEWTRLGWRNSPISEDPRAIMQRVAFQLFDINDEECEQARLRLQDWGNFEPNGSCLIRYFWSVLDRSGDTEAKAQVILDLVESLEIEILAQENTIKDSTSDSEAPPAKSSWYSQWPNLQTGSNPEIPIAMRWTLTLPKIGKIERLWLLAYDDQ